mmetsp:Transcript_34396/g.75299  ORF Transcript_34396/g.75299 Transcript_34396/m.75299 type:complete len:403 (-) Transcript_34396:40-1248(-)
MDSTTGMSAAAAAAPPPEKPLASKDEILACQFSSWYEDFRNMPDAKNKNCTIKSIVIPLPPIFIEYLLSDGVRLPDGANKLSSCAPAHEDGGWSSDDNGSDAAADEDDSIEGKHYSFPELNQSIVDAISSLGGAVIPKLNWSSPKDATWVNNGTMKCETPGDVYILLKSSDFVMHDILHTYDTCAFEGTTSSNVDTATGDSQDDACQYELVLRKWSNLHASQEFRCFVANNTLVAVSQRNHTQHYQHLTKSYMKIRSQILEFFVDAVQNRFASGAISKYVFDCYVDKNGRVWLMDFNPWSTRTDSLLFTWEELLRIAADAANDELQSAANDANGDEEGKDDEIVSCENTKPHMRVVETELEVRQDPISSFRAPIDTVDLMSDAEGANSFQNFMAMCEKPSNL